MNKKEFIKELSLRTGYTEEQCIIINDILEKNFFISKKNKDKIISEIVLKLEVNIEVATSIYETARKILNDGIIYSLKHSFRSKD